MSPISSKMSLRVVPCKMFVVSSLPIIRKMSSTLFSMDVGVDVFEGAEEDVDFEGAVIGEHDRVAAIVLFWESGYCDDVEDLAIGEVT